MDRPSVLRTTVLYSVAPATNVLPIRSSLAWSQLAAIPECYATAWSCVVDHLRLSGDQRLLVRGATSALGQAAVNIAHHLGVSVTATTRRPDREPLLFDIGADDVLIESRDLSVEVRNRYATGVDAVLDLLGNSAIKDSLRMVRRHGHVRVAGFLGGSDPCAVRCSH